MRRFTKHLPWVLGALLIAGLVSFAPDIALAQANADFSDFGQQAGLATQDLRVTIAQIIRVILGFAGVVMVVLVIYGGFLWMTAAGQPDKIKKARQTLINAGIGLAIVLASFAIVQFVLTSLLSATGAGGGPSGSGGPTSGLPGCPTCPVSSADSFIVESWGCFETIEVVPQNAVVQILFSRNVPTDEATLASFITVTPTGGDSPFEDISYSASGKTVSLQPKGTCSDGGDDCFNAFTNYTVAVREGFTSADGLEIECTVFSPCSFGFQTNDVVDTEGPTVNITFPEDGSTISSFTPVTLQAQVTDDSGVGITEFTINSGLVDSAEPSGCDPSGPVSCVANGEWTPGSLPVGVPQNLRAIGYDCSGNSTVSASIQLIPLAEHCVDGVQNFDEEDIDCGGEDCLACTGAACRSNSECASNFCDLTTNTCVVGPQITGVSQTDGAEGNYVTISGVGFGTTPGQVTFVGTENEVAAGVVSCPAPQWTDTQIIVAVPTGAEDGPIRVATAGDSGPVLQDQTDDTYGPLIVDFDVNDTVRPGVCSVTPDTGLAETRITIAGDNFGTDPDAGTVYFDGPRVYAADFFSTVDSWGDNAISIIVPTEAVAGDYDLSVFVSDEGSNTVDFEVSTTALTSGPVIQFINTGLQLCEGDIATEGDVCTSDADCGAGTCEDASTSGGERQYVTIVGENFGNVQGLVVFEDPLLGEVVFEPAFPAQCASNWWTDTLITVQVPSGLTPPTDPDSNPKLITVRRPDYPTSDESNAAELTLVDAGVTPGICALSPSAGPTGIPVTIYGDNLGDSAADFEVTFSSEQVATVETYTNVQQISAEVPAASVTGPVTVAVNSLNSNQLNYQVGNCNEVADICGDGEICCANGSCVNDASLCEDGPVTAQYYYGFSTGPIPNFPTVLLQCDEVYRSPAPSTLWGDGQEACVNAVVSVAFSPGPPAPGMDTSTFNSSSVTVEVCDGSDSAPCASTTGAPIAGSFALSTNTNLYFQPAAALTPDTWYQVTVGTTVQNTLGVALQEPFVFEFKTRADASPCAIDTVLVSPPEYVAPDTTPIPYTALPGTDGCMVLNPDGFLFEWELQNWGKDITFANGNTTISPNATPIATIESLVSSLETPLDDLVTAHPPAGPAGADSALSTINAAQAAFSPYSSILAATPILQNQLTSLLDIMSAVDPSTTTNPTLFTTSLTTITNTNSSITAQLASLQSQQPVIVEPNQETDVGQPAEITATEQISALDDVAELIVSFFDPGVTEGIPACNTACVNAEVSATFSVEMKQTTPTGLLGSHINPDTLASETNVRLFECPNELCGADAVDVTTSHTPIVSPNGKTIQFTNDLNPNSYYRVQIWGGVESLQSVPLWGETDPAGNPVASPLNFGNYHTWVFRTRNNGAACGVSRVEIDPEQLIIDSINGRGALAAEVYGDPDSCSLSGQKLDETTFPWSWVIDQVTNPNTGSPSNLLTFVPSGSQLDLDTALPNACSASCLNTGSLAYPAVCGDGVIDPVYEGCDIALDPIGCTTSCAVVGVTACTSPTDTNCCGNGGVPEGREQCDDGNNIEGDGCSAACLLEGSAAVSTRPGYSATCGNGIVDQLLVANASVSENWGGEACDDGNTINGDGCSSVCLHEPVVNINEIDAVCGDGQIEGGEECDDSNVADGDGCSSICLRETLTVGSSGAWTLPSVTGICGNGGLPERDANGAGEDCEDGNLISGDGCSEVCENEGASAFYGVASFCGDGLIGAGEECETNSTLSDNIPPFDPVQYFTPAGPNAAELVVGGLATTTVTATVTDATTATSAQATAVAGLSCSCTTDASCGSTTAIGCGLNGCCFGRPTVDASETIPLGIGPGGVGQCRNSLVRVRFSEEMDPESFFTPAPSQDPLVLLELIGFADPTNLSNVTPVTSAANCPSGYTFVTSADELIRSPFARFFRSIVRRVFPRAIAQAPSCVVPANLVINDVVSGTPANPIVVTEVLIQYTTALEPNAQYRITVQADSDLTDAVVEGVTSVWNVTMVGNNTTNNQFASAWTQTFTTGPEICSVDLVSLEDQAATPGFFSVSGEGHTLVAQAETVQGTIASPIQEIPGVYEWDWAGSADTDGDGIPDVTWGWGTNISSPDVLNYDPLAFTENNVQATALLETASPAINGVEVATAQLYISTNTLDPSEVGSVVTGSLSNRVFLCENPWPAVGYFPFADTDEYAAELTLGLPGAPAWTLTGPGWSNFATFYCRDSGDPDSTNDDLPALDFIQVPSSQTPGVFREFLFPVLDSNAETNDAIGVRIAGNEDYLSPVQWFLDQGFVGAPQALEIDGFEAVQDDRTVYVAAPNIDPNNDTIFPNMYILAYNEGASSETIEIFNALLQNIEFVANTVAGEPLLTNTQLCSQLGSTGIDPVENASGELVSCTADADCAGVIAASGNPVFCDSNKDKLRRDMRRLVDVNQIVAELEAYADNNRRCSVTTNQVCTVDADCSGAETCVDTVPSLSSGTFIPAMSWSAWPSWQARLANTLGTALPTDPLNSFNECPSGYDSDSCFNPATAVAICPVDSHVYRYQSLSGEAYNLWADLEYGDNETNYEWDVAIGIGADNGTVYVGNATPGNPAGFVTAPSCNGGTFSASNVCGDGNIGLGEFCEVGDVSSAACQVCVGGSNDGLACLTNADCGGGVCTDGVQAVECLTDCSAFQTIGQSAAACVPQSCGNGFVDPGEVCDDGAQNGQYGFCGFDCTVATSIFCGDGELGGAEVCDCGANSSYLSTAISNGFSCGAYNGQYVADSTQSCSLNCSGPGPSCGNGIVEPPNEQCENAEVDEWGGALCADGSPCGEDASNFSCLDGSTCGDGATACPLDSEGFEQIRTRQCYTNDTAPTPTQACNYPDPASTSAAGWSACAPAGACGNGIQEGPEECDDGNNSNNDACTNTCELNVCGDSFRNIGVESCDLGSANGTPCSPQYGSTCNYCTTSCNFATVTGGFCGDGEINGGEVCDGTDRPGRCFKEGANPSTRELGGTCDTVADCPGSAAQGWWCSPNVGVCNGGSRVQPASAQDWIYNGQPCLGNTHGNRACGQPGVPANDPFVGECVIPDCSSTCSQSCPHTYNNGSVLAEAEGSGNLTTSIDLHSYLSGPSPDEATIQFPACQAGVSLSADVSFENVIAPPVDVLFMIDLSGSMTAAADGGVPSTGEPTRLDIVQGALSDAVEDLFNNFNDPGQLNIAIASFNCSESIRTSYNGSPSTGCARVNQTWTTVESQLEVAINNLSAQNGTPTVDAMHVALDTILTRPVDNERIIVLLTDGDPKIPDTVIGETSCPNYDMGNTYNSCVMVDMQQYRTDILDAGVKLYSAAIASSSNLIGRTAHMSGEDCGTNWNSRTDCVPNEDGVQYAYSGETEEEIVDMVQDIVDSILGLTFNYNIANGNSGTVNDGLNVPLPFPDNFACPSSGVFSVPINVTYAGEGAVNLSNFQVQYCPF